AGAPAVPFHGDLTGGGLPVGGAYAVPGRRGTPRPAVPARRTAARGSQPNGPRRLVGAPGFGYH
ncbi:hypothetical protein ACFWN1_32560, partial [Streptomyces sp. NPDC058459]|uniref:hypothetical protein n=1 Tax=Streptomyces sp. NPDC058459 TaxID=3346508 RepID=UPI00365339EB